MNETASEGIDQLQAHIVELEQQLFAEKAARLRAEAAVAEMRDAAFCHCGKPAACLVRYEGDGPVQFACDECCGHGNEDGWCKRLDDCGTGWLSLKTAASDFVHNVKHNHIYGFGDLVRSVSVDASFCELVKALALLDGKESV